MEVAYKKVYPQRNIFYLALLLALKHLKNRLGVSRNRILSSLARYLMNKRLEALLPLAITFTRYTPGL
jgi:hypothetical protein